MMLMMMRRESAAAGRGRLEASPVVTAKVGVWSGDDGTPAAAVQEVRVGASVW